ncbi:MAG: hypothetical protein K2X02_02115 [Alphaproteobacteria bacterium]|nr:hypothetical protein [Alphaproteobacteria bacterium]
MKLKKFLYMYFFVNIFLVNVSLTIENEKETREIQTAIKALGPSRSFVYYDLHLSENEKSAGNALKISKTDSYNNYGNLNVLESEVREFIKTLGKVNNTNAKEVAGLIVRLVNEILQASEQETAWVAVRAFTPISEYDVPRWHTDGYYFEPYSGDLYKFALTLKGSPTLFYRLPDNKREEFYALRGKGTEQNDYNRQALADMLGQFKEAISIAHPYQGAVFIVGPNNAAVHSEPPIKEERLFISILPGSKTQIKEWESK